MELDLNISHFTCIRRLRMELDSMITWMFEHALVVCGCSSTSMSYFRGLVYHVVVSVWSSTLFSTCYIHWTSPYGARHYEHIFFIMFWSSVDAARSHSYRHVPRYHMLVSGWSSTSVLHMLHAFVVSMGSSTIWTHIFHHAMVVCGCSSITFVQTYSQISTGCLWTELNLSVAYVTFIRRLRRELDNMNTYLFIMLWSSVDAVRLYFCKHSLRYHVVISGWSSTSLFHMLHAFVVSVGSSTLWTHIFHHAWVVCGCSSITFVKTYSQISAGCLWTELNRNVAHVTFIRRLRREFDNMNTSIFYTVWSSVDAARSYFV